MGLWAQVNMRKPMDLFGPNTVLIRKERVKGEKKMRTDKR